MKPRAASIPEARRDALIVFVLAFTLRLLSLAASADNPLLGSPALDEAYYIALGRAIASGYLLGEKGLFFMDPLYGYALGAVFYVFGDNLTTVRLLQIGADSACAVIVLVMGSRAWDRRAGLFAGVFYAAYKVSFFYTLLILKTTFAAAACLVFTLVLMEAARRKGALWWLGLGALGGLSTLLRANLLLLSPFGVLLYLLIEKPPARVFLKNTALFTLALFSVLSLQAARNWIATGQAVFLNTQSGRLFYASNNPENLTGRYNVPSFSRPNPEDSERDFHAEAERRLGGPLSPGEVSRYWWGEAISFLVENPAAAAALIFNKVKGTLGDHEIPTNHSFYLAARFSEVLRLPLPGFAFALALGAPGLFLAMRSRREARWLLAPIGAVLVTILLFYTSSRLRAPLAPFLMIGAGVSASALAGFVKEKRAAAAALLAGPAAGLFLLSVSIPAPPGSGNGEFLLAKAYWRQGRPGPAWETAREAAEKYPGQARFHNLMGMAALSAGKLDEAERAFSTAAGMEPGQADPYHNLGIVHLSAGRPEKAVETLLAAIEIDPRPESLFVLGRAYERMGETEKARESYQRALRGLKPGDPLRTRVMERLAGL